MFSNRAVGYSYDLFRSTFDFSSFPLHKSLRSITKQIDRPLHSLFTIYGAYEITDNQVVLAIFDIRINLDDDESEENQRPKIEVSFAEDTTRLRCPISVRDLLTQSDYILRAEQAFPGIMEEMLLEKERRKLTIFTDEELELLNNDIPF